VCTSFFNLLFLSFSTIYLNNVLINIYYFTNYIIKRGKEQFGQTINEFYGQTEANLLVGNCSKIMRIIPGSMGKGARGREEKRKRSRS
jgi:hypothetical protein